jgi:hypothetical protein
MFAEERACCSGKSRADEYNNLFGDDDDDDDDVGRCCRANAELVLRSSTAHPSPHSSTNGNPVDRRSDRI